MAERTANGATPTSGSRPRRRALQGAFVETGGDDGRGTWRRRYFPRLSGRARSHQCAGGAEPPRGRQHRDVDDVPLRRAFGREVYPYHEPLLRARRQDDRDPHAEWRNGGARPLHLAGQEFDHNIVRQASRGELGRLLPPGIEVYKYRAALLHAKTMVIDGVWSTGQHQPRPPVLRPQRRAESGHLRSGSR